MSSLSLISSLEYDMNEKQSEASGIPLADLPEKIGYSIGGAAISALNGFYNTGVSILNLANDEDIEFADTSQWINDWMSGDAAEFYEDHQDFIDIGGLVAGSLVPGTLAIKGLRLLQPKLQKGLSAYAAGKSNAYSSMITRIQKTLIPEAEYSKLAQSIRAGNNQIFSKMDSLKLAKEAGMQNILEAAVFEIATVTTMAKHSSLSPDDLDYFESIAHNAGNIAFGTFFGGAIGGLATYASKAGKIKSLYAEMAPLNNAYAMNKYATVNASLLGDKIVDDISALSSRSGDIDNLKASIDSAVGDGAVQDISLLESQLALAEKSLQQARNKLFTDIGDGINQPIVKDRLVQWMDNKSAREIADIFAGAEKITTINRTGNLVDPVMDVTIKFDGVPPIETGMSWDARRRILAVPKEEILRMDADDIYQMIDDTYSIQKGKNLLKKFEGTDVVNKIDAELKTFINDEYKLDLDIIDDINKQIDVATLADDIDELEKLGPILERHETMLRVKSSREHSLSKVWRAMNSADDKTFKQLQKDFPETFQAFTKSRGMRTEFGPTEAYFDLVDGKIVRNQTVVPNAVDLGDLKIKADTISVEGTQFSFNISEVKPIFDMNNVEATAKYALAESDPERLLRGYLSGTRAKVITAYDLPRAHAAMILMKNKKLAKKHKIAYENTKGEIKFFENHNDLMKEVVLAKRLAIPRMTAKKNLGKTQIATILDTSEEWVTGDHLARRKIETNSVFKSFAKGTEEVGYHNTPRWMKVQYSKDFRNEAEITGMLNAEQRMNMESQINKNTAASYFGNSMNQLSHGDTGLVGGADQSTSLLAANQARYGLDWIKGVGSFLNNRHNKRLAEVPKTFSGNAQKVARNPKSIAELNIVRNMGRQGRYFVYEGVGDMLTKEMVTNGNVTLMKLLEMDPALKGNLIRVFQEAMPNNTFRKAGMVHQEVISKVRDGMNSIDAVIKFDKNGKLAQDSLESINAIIKRIDSSIKDDGVIKNLGKLAQYEFDNVETSNFIKQWVTENNKSITHRKKLGSRQGTNISYQENMFYAGSIDTSMYDHVAMVKFKNSSKIYGSKNTGVIVAKSDADFKKKIAKLEETMGEEVEISTLGEQEDFFKARDIYDADMAVSENVVDATMMNNGVLWDVMPEFNDNIVQEMLNGHVKSMRNLDRGYASLLYEREIAEFAQMSKVFNPKGSISAAGRKTATDPWAQQINTMLDVSQSGDWKIYTSVQQQVGDSLQKAVSTVRGLLLRANKSDLDAEFQKIDEYLERTGLPRPYNEASDYLKLNSNVPAERLEAFTARLNGLASTVMLRLDTAQSIVNALSMPIMLFPEMQRLRGYIKAENVAKLEDLTHTTLTTGVREPSNMKLAGGATIEFWTHPNRKQMIQEFKDQGIVGNTLHEIQSAAEAISLRPNMDEGIIKKAGKGIISTLAKPADFSEEFVKFVAARTAQKVLELSTIDKSAQWAIIRNFVDKVHGNYVASQRPTLFKGFAGQAIGLFQTYQFNLYQRLFSHLGSGSKKASLTMIGTQASIFGAQSIPGFQQLNDHIAKRSENFNNIYSRANKNFGEDTAEWFIYGVGSNIFKPIPGLGGIDLYSRGDLTPRTPILIPTSLDEIPVVAMTKKALSSMVGAVGKSVKAIGTGEPQAIGTIMLEALAHNGLNRPIAGVSQLALGYRTTNQGKLINTYNESDNYAWTAFTKAIGAKTLDEGMAVSQFYRALKYKTARYEKLDTLGQAFRDVIRSNDGLATAETNKHFLEEYVAQGGNHENYARWSQNQVAGANESVINALRESNSTPEGRYLQSVIGGDVAEF